MHVTKEVFVVHCSPGKAGEPEGEATDKGGWERYSADWRNFFECMLAPVARQAAGGMQSFPSYRKGPHCSHLECKPQLCCTGKPDPFALQITSRSTFAVSDQHSCPAPCGIDQSMAAME
jgi:hypothetical protein